MKTVPANHVKNFSGRLVDVRTLEEFASERLSCAACVPLERLLSAASEWDPNEPLLVMCKSGARSKQAAQQLADVGFTNVAMLEGGIEACKKADVDVIRGPKRIPIMRQVLIGASVLLLVGLALSLVDPRFILIDLFVACGLLMAGVTGFCPMAKLLALMPWNRITCATGGSCDQGV